MASKTGLRVCPRSVREYSTRGGTSANTSRWTIPDSSMVRRLVVSTFWEIPPIERCSSLNRMTPLRLRSRKIRTCHLLPMSVRVVSTGHAGKELSRSFVISPYPKVQVNANSYLLAPTALSCAYFQLDCVNHSVCLVERQHRKRAIRQKGMHYDQEDRSSRGKW